MTTKPRSESAERRYRKRQRSLKRSKSLNSKPTEGCRPKKSKLLTYKDLDQYQLDAYSKIHSWWRVSQECGGIPSPLTIGGYAGTGKSTLLSIALPPLRNINGSNVDIKYVAYTGKASSVLESKGLNSSTIHSLIYEIDLDPDRVAGKKFILRRPEEIEAELIVVDEASMLPDELREDLESLGIPIVYTGDHGQLPPVSGKGNVMSDPELRLEEVHRQAAKSGIIQLATKVREGLPTKKGYYGETKDAQIVGCEAIEDIKLLSSADMIICYTNAKKNELNTLLREYKKYEGEVPQKGERLICIKNNKRWGVVNGLIVYVLDIVDEGDSYRMDCIDEMGKIYPNIYVATQYFKGYVHPEVQSGAKLNLFEYAYAITGHKSQGSQWDTVVIIEDKMFRQKVSFKKRWLYTVITRAAKKLIWVSRFK